MDQIIALLLAYKYFVIFPLAVIEGPIITILSGFLSSQGVLNLYIVYGLLILADLVGDSLYYIIGRFGRHGFLEKWGHYIGLTKARIGSLDRYFDGHSGKTIIIAKLSHAVVIPILIAAGAAKMPYWRFVWFNFLATLPKSLALLLVGYFFGHAYKLINQYIDSFAIIAPILIGIAILLYLLFKMIFKKIKTGKI